MPYFISFLLSNNNKLILVLFIAEPIKCAPGKRKGSVLVSSTGLSFRFSSKSSRQCDIVSIARILSFANIYCILVWVDNPEAQISKNLDQTSVPFQTRRQPQFPYIFISISSEHVRRARIHELMTPPSKIDFARVVPFFAYFDPFLFLPSFRSSSLRSRLFFPRSDIDRKSNGHQTNCWLDGEQELINNQNFIKNVARNASLLIENRLDNDS